MICESRIPVLIMQDPGLGHCGTLISGGPIAKNLRKNFSSTVQNGHEITTLNIDSETFPKKSETEHFPTSMIKLLTGG